MRVDPARAKWRPPLVLVVGAVLLVVLLLPLAALVFSFPELLGNPNDFRAVLPAIVLVILSTVVVGYVFLRTLTGPVRELTRRTILLRGGDRSAVAPLRHHGSREVAELTNGLFSMANSLFHRTEYISTFATHVSHEIKTPLTSIRGAVELVLDQGDDMTPDERRKFLENALADTQRISDLLARLRALAHADNPQERGVCRIDEIIKGIEGRFSHLSIEMSGDVCASVALTGENLSIVLRNLIENAEQNGASIVRLEVVELNHACLIDISDDGDGISEGNEQRIFDLFFTTRRDSGGTGMGLGIVKSMLQSHGGNITLVPPSSGSGACFQLNLPLASA